MYVQIKKKQVCNTERLSKLPEGSIVVLSKVEAQKIINSIYNLKVVID